MTTNEFCESSGLAPRELRRWLETGLLEAETIGIPGSGNRYVFALGQLERARLVKALLRKGVSLA
jgi:DNA-binding transcriptional MerR regulator